MTKLHSHLKKGFISILSLTLIFSNISVYAIDDTTNIIIEENNLDNSLIHNHNSDSYEENIITQESEENLSTYDTSINDINSIDLYSNNEGISTYSIGSFDITLTPNTNGYGSVSLDWSKYNYANKNFKVYKSSDGGKSYETVGIDYTSVKEVKCLQIYPCTEAEGQLKKWMETNGYGKGIIKVDSVYIDTFNSNPNAYLKDSSGNWKYNVLYFGAWDGYNFKDLSPNAYNLVRQFTNAGRGVIFGHDTLGKNSINHTNGGTDKTYFNKFASDLGLTLSNWGENGDNTNSLGSDHVVLKRKSLLSTYPWNLGEVGTTFEIPFAHNFSQALNDTSKIDFQFTGISQEKYNKSWYVTSTNNYAMIQTGHSNGAATSDEQKITANLIFYMNQLLFNTYTTNDASAQDFAKPNKPSVSISNNNFTWSATDNGSTYYYYVESYDKNDTTSSGLLAKSNTKSLTVTTGVKSYRYILDNNENTKVTTSTGTKTTSTSLALDGSHKYLHIIAIDGAGNVSDTTTYKIPDATIIFDANGGSVSFASKTISYASTIGDLPTASRNGYTFKQWNTNNSGTGDVITSTYKMIWPSNHTVYAIWNPINYTISYNLNGGSANNKSSYNIETDTFTLSNPTKTGYTFAGWTGSNGTTKQISVSITKGSTGNKSYTANYTINQYDVTYIDVIDSITGAQLGKTTKKVNYNSNVRGSDIGSSTNDNAYYNGYYYSSDTSATVTTNGATVYRIFKLRTIDKTSNLTWNDNNNKNGFRPSKYTLKLMRNGALFKQVELTSSQTSYTFSNLTKYDSNGKTFKYTFEVDASDRYKITLDENCNTITESYQNSTFSVTIPKTISLNGVTGKGTYNVKVSGTFYYNDTLTVTPSSTFTLKDKNSINSLNASVTQTNTSFNKNNLGSTSGSISLNKTKFAGKYNGTFNFAIKFTLKN